MSPLSGLCELFVAEFCTATYYPSHRAAGNHHRTAIIVAAWTRHGLTWTEMPEVRFRCTYMYIYIYIQFHFVWQRVWPEFHGRLVFIEDIASSWCDAHHLAYGQPLSVEVRCHHWSFQWLRGYQERQNLTRDSRDVDIAFYCTCPITRTHRRIQFKSSFQRCTSPIPWIEF